MRTSIEFNRPFSNVLLKHQRPDGAQRHHVLVTLKDIVGDIGSYVKNYLGRNCSRP